MSGEQSFDDKESALAVFLQKYNAMRTEIYNRSTAQHTLINLNVTALGVVTGFVLSGQGNFLLLLLIPIISSSFGLLYFDHAGAIERVGVYLKVMLEPKMSQAVTGTSLDWEQFSAYTFRENPAARVAFAAPLFILFLGAPIVSTMAVAPALNQPWLWIIWVIGLFLEILLLVEWWRATFGGSLRFNEELAERYQGSN